MYQILRTAFFDFNLIPGSHNGGSIKTSIVQKTKCSERHLPDQSKSESGGFLGDGGLTISTFNLSPCCNGKGVAGTSSRGGNPYLSFSCSPSIWKISRIFVLRLSNVASGSSVNCAWGEIEGRCYFYCENVSLKFEFSGSGSGYGGLKVFP